MQANNQSGNSFKIVTMPDKMPSDILKEKKLEIGFDPTLFTEKSLSILFNKSNIKCKPIINNLIDKIWKRKIKKSKSKFYSLPKKSVSEKYQSKINKVSNYLKRKKIKFFIYNCK